ncbi:MAG TPA: hypothetical protein VKD71_01605 [Gemmataceae bacterium]|nr:hypothetical protein [Gemmataceae bacterium]
MTVAAATRFARTESVAERQGAPRAAAWDGLTVSREDIRFQTRRPGVLSIEVTIHNTGAKRSAATFGLLRSAPLGAFVSWRPLGVLEIPAIEPRRSTVVRHEVRYRPAAAPAGADKLPPNRLLTALGLDDPDGDNSQLPADPLALFKRGGIHWAGNLNIFFPGKDVERHLAQALRIYPGRVNLAMFIVGDRKRDVYRFRLTGNGAAWGARLVDFGTGDSFAALVGKGGIETGAWTRPTTGLLMLALEPPANATTGAVNVHVQQQSTGREAVVEFSLDADAAGPGCYVV